MYLVTPHYFFLPPFFALVTVIINGRSNAAFDGTAWTSPALTFGAAGRGVPRWMVVLPRDALFWAHLKPTNKPIRPNFVAQLGAASRVPRMTVTDEPQVSTPPVDEEKPAAKASMVVVNADNTEFSAGVLGGVAGE